MLTFQIFSATILILGIVVVALGVKAVPQGYNYTVERFGKYTKTLRPGLNFIIPVIDLIGSKMNMMEIVRDIEPQDVITKDNASSKIDGIVFYQIFDAAKASYEVNDLDRGIINLCLTNLRSVAGTMDLDELLSNREVIATKILTIVDEATQAWGVKVMRIEIKDVSPPKELVEAMSQQMIAERTKRALITEAEGIRESEITKADGEKKSAILTAEGSKQAAFLEAEARERSAEAEAKATAVVSQAVAEGDVQALNYFIAQNYVEAISKFGESPNEKLVFMPLESSSVIGAIGGISKLFEAGGAGAASSGTAK